MSRLDCEKDTSLAIYPLSSTTSCKSLSAFSQLLSSCIGPSGRNHVIRNACGGHMTVTSSCLRLLSTISLSRSELKLVASAVLGHLQQCADGGLFMAHMCLELTKSTLDIDICHSIVSSAFTLFVSIIGNYIKSSDNAITIKADFSNVNVLLAYVHSILKSKSLLNIQPHSLKELSFIILNAFVKAIPSSPTHRWSNGVFVIGLEKQPIRSCKNVDGIMLEFPEYGKLSELTSNLKSKHCGINRGSRFKVALITCSLSGDIDDIVDATFEGTEQQFSDMQEHVFKQMKQLCNTLETEGVALVLCQRVIHPKLKTLLKTKEIIYLDRLGLLPVPFIKDLTGCQPITSVLLNAQAIRECLGKLTSISPCIEDNKDYICLQNKETLTNIVTLVACAEWEERLLELKQCVNTCLKGLEFLAKEPWLLMGGGCWQFHCSRILENNIFSSLRQTAEKLSCSELTVRRLLAIFTSCLNRWCLTLKQPQEHLSLDSASGHCWTVTKDTLFPSVNDKELTKPCCCGLKAIAFDNLQNLDIVVPMKITCDNLLSSKEKEKEQTVVSPVFNNTVSNSFDDCVLDNMTVYMEALHKGVLTTGLLLSVGLLVCDRN